ncbi:MAG: hypothetical protein IPL73_10995 [Candidatus Obscuribacter sp.]|nr:hypothetical protein [Candidatus Obscuribacter sp.]
MTHKTSSNPAWQGSLIVILIGAIMAFLGFVFPGLYWCLNTPGDTEMISLAAALLFGLAGVIVALYGVAMAIGHTLAASHR